MGKKYEVDGVQAELDDYLPDDFDPDKLDTNDRRRREEALGLEPGEQG